MRFQRDARRLSRSKVVHHATAAALLIAAGSTAAAHAGLWINPLGGAWNVAGNWDTGMVPNAPDAVAEIGVGGVYSVNLPTGNTAVGKLIISNADAAAIVPSAGTLQLHDPGTDVSGLLQVNTFSASASAATLNAAQSTTLAGFGATRLAGITPTRARITTSDGAVLTIDGGHAVFGSGQIAGQVVNNGLIEANDIESRVLQLSAPSIVNNGQIGASSAGNLILAGIAVDQFGGGQIFSSGPDALVDFTGNGSVLGGVLTTTPDSVPMVRNSGTTTLEDVTLAGGLLVQPAGTIVLAGAGLTNNGVLGINSFSASASAATLSVPASAALSGDGEVRLRGISTTRAQITGAPGSILTIGEDQVVAGSGRISANFINQGFIDADDPDYTLEVNVSSGMNHRSIRAVAGGHLNFANSFITQSSTGFIVADGPGSFVEFTGNGTVNGGTILSAVGAEPITRQSGSTTMIDVTLKGEVLVQPAGTIAIAGTGLTNDGVLRVNNFSASASSANVSVIGSPSILGIGTVRLEGISATRAQISGGIGETLTIGPDQTIAGSGRILMSFINNGLIDADNPDYQLQLSVTDATNNSTIRASDGGWMTIANSTIEQAPGAAIVAEGPDSLVEFIGTCTITGGEIASTPDAPPMRRSSGITTLDGVQSNAHLAIDPGGTIAVVDEVFTNNGRLDIGIPSASASMPILNFLATDPVITGTGEVAFSKPIGTPPRIVGTGTLTNDIDHTISGRGQVLLGLNNAGTIKPGDPTGIISVTGGYTATETSVHHITIAGASDFSRINATGPLAVDGDIVLSIDPDFLPPVGSTYAFISGSSATGTMTVIEAPQIGRLVFNAITGPDRVDIVVTVCADLNDDGIVNAADLGIMLAAFGTSDAGDINGDGITNAADLGLLLNAFGAICGQ